MIAWRNIEHETYDAELSFIDGKPFFKYKYELFYRGSRSKKEIANELLKEQTSVETQLGMKLTITYENRKLYLEVTTHAFFDEEVLFDKIKACYESIFLIPEKLTGLIEEIYVRGGNPLNYIEITFKSGGNNANNVFNTLNGRAAVLGMNVLPNPQNSNSLLLIPNDQMSIEELMIKKDFLLLHKQKFYEQCKVPAIATEKAEPSFKKQKLNSSGSFNFPLSGKVDYQKPKYSSSGLWFDRGKSQRLQAKSPAEIIDLTEKNDYSSAEFRSQLLNGTLFSSDEFKVVSAANESLKRKAEETEVSQAYEVQTPVKQSQVNQLNTLDEVAEFINGSNLQF